MTESEPTVMVSLMAAAESLDLQVEISGEC
jgi:hypothetical protein